VGLNYLKHYGRRALTGSKDPTELHEANANAVYKTFSELKGGPLKLAQMLSIDRNLLPEAYSRQFAQAQYSAPPLSYPLVARTFRREFGREPHELFDEFSREALHGASIGQVHKARKAGRDLAVKVQYPGVADSLKNDLRIVKPLALQVLGLRERDVAAYFAEVEERLLEETDYARELEKSQQLSAASAHLAHLRFPAYYPEWSSARVLTMDWVDGEPLDRFADGPANQAARDQIGQALWDFYHHQIHELRVFHADPHPGNFLIRDGDLWVLDFGCTKALKPEFYHLQFQFLDPALLDDAGRLERALESLNVILPDDDANFRQQIVLLCRGSLDLVGKPFRSETFDFGDPEFMQAIYDLGLESRNNEIVRSPRGSRGSPHTIYVNRAYFGLYSLLARLRARVRTDAERWIAMGASPRLQT
jgi:predicted unusual protein kinase regulating ubiquinone biosynthesis (AarF/ABC1/UbiB family)